MTTPTNARNPELARRGVTALLAGIGFDLECEALRDTPRRVADAYAEMLSGYDDDAGRHLGVTFEQPGADDIVALVGVPFVSVCEHHLLPFTGTASLAYLPGGDRVVGLSKLARVVDVFARRLQLQERLGAQIADALELHLKPRGVAVALEAQHGCMTCRGVMKPGAAMRTHTFRGLFRDNPAVKAEVTGMLR